MLFTSLAVLATASLTLAQDPIHTLFRRDAHKQLKRDLNGHHLYPLQPALKASQPEDLTIDIPIDHFSTNSGTFKNRYWINATYYKAGGPVFLQDVGESTVTDEFVQSYLMESGAASSVMQMAQRYDGLGLMIEHRYYGDSQPYPVDEMTGLPNDGYAAWQYHTADQALEDVVYIANNFKPKGLDQYWSQLAPTQTPWIFIGGSYPGNRAAWIRIRNPDVIYASWASSAPVQTTENMATYYEQVYKDMTANCSADMAAASRYLTTVLTSGTDNEKALVTILSNLAQQPANISQYTSLSNSQILSAFKGANQTDFGISYNIANFVGSSLQSYGFDYALLPYCNAVESFNPKTLSSSSIGSLINTIFNNNLGARPTSEGIAATYDDESAFYALVYGIYAQYVDAMQAGSGDTNQTVDYSAIRDGVSWTYQTCTEFGYFQVADNSSQYNLLSPFINTTSWQQEQCDAQFGYFSTFPSSPDTQKLIKEYGGWTMNPSQVMFTDGLKDPWHTLSVQTEEKSGPNRATTNTVPGCNATTSDNKVFGLTYKNGYHVSDLLGDTGYAAQGQQLFAKALDTWLPCFQKHSVNNTATPTTTNSPASAAGTTPSATASKTGAAVALTGRGGAQMGIAAAVLAAVVLI